MKLGCVCTGGGEGELLSTYVLSGLLRLLLCIATTIMMDEWRIGFVLGFGRLNLGTGWGLAANNKAAVRGVSFNRISLWVK